MRQLPPAALALSPRLAAADPGALRAAGAAATGIAAQVSSQAGLLEAVSGRLQAGLWVSPGASAFVSRSLEQAQHMRVAARLAGDLGAALGSLAGRLSAAKSDALAAVARGRQADAAAEELNGRVRVQHALLPQDPDSLLLNEREVQVVADARDAAKAALAQAEARASEAWKQAAADFDLVAYASPAMRARMSAPGWDPAAAVWLAASGAPALACGVMSQLGFASNGVITGPDGRSYPLVLQTAWSDDGRLLVTSRENPDTSGYRELAVRFGRTEFGPKAAGWQKVAVALGGAAGAAYPDQATFSPALLRQLRLMSGGGAYLDTVTPDGGDPVKEAPAAAPKGKKHEDYWSTPTQGLAGGKRAGIPDAIGLVDGVIGGALLATRLDDGRIADYRVVFEEDELGRRRARLQLFRVMTVPGKPPRAVVEGGYVDRSGKLAGTPVTGEDPTLGPIMIPAQ